MRRASRASELDGTPSVGRGRDDTNDSVRRPPLPPAGFDFPSSSRGSITSTTSPASSFPGRRRPLSCASNSTTEHDSVTVCPGASIEGSAHLMERVYGS